LAEVDDNERFELTMHELRVMGGIGRALGIVSTVLGVAMRSAGAAGADGPVQIRSQLGDVCLDAPSLIWDIPVVINPCNGTDFQRWNLTGRQLENAAFPGKCLTMPVESGALHIEYCRDAFVQHWSIQPNGQVTSDSGSCLTVLGGPGPGTRVAARWCNGDPGQGWESVP
jgi:Ricin-type beta-trefoil lectin domain